MAGEALNLFDRDGTRLRRDDVVEITGSERFGTFKARVTGEDGERVILRPLSGTAPADEDYTSSQRRVRLLKRDDAIGTITEIKTAQPPDLGVESYILPINARPAFAIGRPAPKKPKQKEIDALMGDVPAPVRAIVREIRTDDGMAEGMTLMMDRVSDFESPLTAMFAGIAVHAPARQHFEERLDGMWVKNRDGSLGPQGEVVIGSGLHAAIYCAARVAAGHPRPVVIEQSPRVGGAFAMTKGAAFFLNSRNRPGRLALPGMPGALNVVPGAPLQPSDISGDEYQSNADLALAIRLTLAMYAKVVPDRMVETVVRARGEAGEGYAVTTSNGSFFAKRVVNATGLGEPKRLSFEDPRYMDFETFMGLFDQPFPLRGMNRVAVIGAGDSGNTTVEALTGQGPGTGWSVASIDFPEQIDWFGLADKIGTVNVTRQGWENCNRSRYKGLGRLFENGNLPPNRQTPARVIARERAVSVAPGYDSVYVNEEPYDAVIVCTGFQRRRAVFEGYEEIPVSLGTGSGRTLAMSYGESTDQLFAVGPAARIKVSEDERRLPALSQIPENSTSLFRYAARTAAFGQRLRAA
jgi:hypothetical protein